MPSAAVAGGRGQHRLCVDGDPQLVDVAPELLPGEFGDLVGVLLGGDLVRPHRLEVVAKLGEV